MAGIGFKLRRFTEQETVLGLLQGYGSAAVVVAGPWLLTVLSLLIARAGSRLAGRDTADFGALVAYCYAFSLILTGPLQNLITRFLSDRLHEKDETAHLPCYLSSGVVLAPVSLLLGLILFGRLPIPADDRLCAVFTFGTVCQIWLAMVFLGAVRAYAWIVKSFALGFGVTLIGTVVRPGGLPWNFWFGQATTLGMLTHLLLREFRWSRSPIDLRFLAYARVYPALPLAGFLFYLAVWIGVMVSWAGPRAELMAGLWVEPEQDTATFLGMLTTLPALTLFFVRTETEFFVSYRAFFGGILDRTARLVELAAFKTGMRSALSRGAVALLLAQGVVSCLCVWLLPRALGVSGDYERVLRWCIVGAWATTMVQFETMILYYYQRYWLAAAVCGVFCLVHGAVAWLTSLSPFWHGSALLVGALAAMPLGAWWIAEEMRELEFRTFMSQPMPGTLAWVPPGQEFARQVRSEGRWLEDFA